MEIYRTMHTVEDKLIQIMITLPQSAIGITYPELHYCTPDKSRSTLEYGCLDLTLNVFIKTDQDNFLKLYSDDSARTLTPEVFNALGLFNVSLDELAARLLQAVNK